MKQLGFLGMGNMASAIAGGLIQKGVLSPRQIAAYDIMQDKLNAFAQSQGFRPCSSAEELAAESDALLVAVKPYYVEEALSPILPLLEGKVLLSVAAGWDYARYEALLPPSVRHLSIMPNTPALVGEGVLLLEERHSLTAEEFAQVRQWFGALGQVHVLASDLMDIGGTVSSCSPAFFALAVEAMADAGVMYGLPRPVAYALVGQAMAGTGKMLLETGMHPGALKDMVCSPRGTTIQGVAALEEKGLRTAMLSAVERVMDR